MYLGGLWCSTKKPPTFTFLEPIFRQFKKLEETDELPVVVYPGII